MCCWRCLPAIALLKIVESSLRIPSPFILKAHHVLYHHHHYYHRHHHHHHYHHYHHHYRHHDHDHHHHHHHHHDLEPRVFPACLLACLLTPLLALWPLLTFCIMHI
uniref:Uncharacterized protein n=1 Tax=Glossina brevipalpis TaxID=37001 RepID=A0A1A9WE64_9MUSC